MDWGVLELGTLPVLPTSSAQPSVQDANQEQNSRLSEKKWLGFPAVA